MTKLGNAIQLSFCPGIEAKFTILEPRHAQANKILTRGVWAPLNRISVSLCLPIHRMPQRKHQEEKIQHGT